ESGWESQPTTESSTKESKSLYGSLQVDHPLSRLVPNSVFVVAAAHQQCNTAQQTRMINFRPLHSVHNVKKAKPKKKRRTNRRQYNPTGVTGSRTSTPNKAM